MTLIRSLFVILIGLATSAQAEGPADCRDIRFEGTGYTVCTVDMKYDALRLFLKDEDGEILGSFSAVSQMLAKEGRSLRFAMNAGMYHEDRSPVGHYVENGNEIMRVIENAGPGNFGMLPNGVLCIRDDRVDVIETRSYQKTRPDCRYATQSGPMLVINGKLHHRFIKNSTSRYIRNGVGTSADGRYAYFAISDQMVNFHEFARLFRDKIGVSNALFLDGNVSRLYAPQLGRNDLGFALGPIVGAVELIE